MASPLGSSVSESGTQIGDYSLQCRIGEGTFGTVYRAIHRRTNEVYAVKVMMTDTIRAHGLESSVRREATVLQGLRHPHVVSLVKVLQSPQAFYFVMELADGGELFDRVIQSRCFTEPVARRYFQQLMSAIHFCHSQNVAHRDLKAENCLLDSNAALKVCDFGLCSKRPRIEDESQTSPLEQRANVNFLQAGTVSYMTPEMLSGVDYDEFAADLWSAGVILYFMVTGSLPFDGPSEEETIYNILHHVVDFSRVSQADLRAFLERMLAFDPMERPSLDTILQDAWFLTDIDPQLFPREALPIERMSRSSSRVFLDFSGRHKDENHKIVDVTEEEIGAIYQIFQSIDTDGYGDKITRDEMRDAVISLRRGKVDKGVLEQIMSILDPQNVGFISFEQFRDAWIEHDFARTYFKDANIAQLSSLSNVIHNSVEKEVVRQLRAAFDLFDDSHSGVIVKDKWRQVFVNAQIDVTDDEITRLVQYVGSLTDNAITFEDFLIGIVKRDLLIKHPMGKKLAKAANLTNFAMARQVNEFLTTGFTVVGLRDAVLEKIANYDPQRLRRTPCAEPCTCDFNALITVPFQWVKETNGAPRVACAFDVVIIPTSCVGYSVIKVNRIHGPTADFHDAVLCVYAALETERSQALNDMAPVGESELM